jgi:small nuclear ribonucleoprotein (snRNP)-like protein
LKAEWLKHLKGEDRERFKEYLLNSSGVFDRLHTLLKERVKVQKREDYMASGWPYLRAFDDGYNKALEDVMDLIAFRKED